MMRSANGGPQSQRIVNRRSINTQTFSARFSRDRTLTLQGFSQAACRLGSNPLIASNGRDVPMCPAAGRSLRYVHFENRPRIREWRS